MRDRGLLPDFSPAVAEQVNVLTHRASATPADIRDQRALLWASIDNDDSRDLDQLSVAEALGGGNVRVRVAIADVDALVPPGTPIDDHARMNTTSVYTAAQIFPMLPERLSTDLTSLGQDAERVSIVVSMDVDKDGEVVGSEVYRALVLNRAKLAYNSVSAWLDGTGPAPARVASVRGMDQQLRLQDEVAQRMVRARQRRGALTLDTLEAQPVLHDGVLSDLRPDEKNRAKALIEHFMIGANQVVARFLESQGYASIRRVLRQPERWERIVALAAEHDERLPPSPDANALNALLIRLRAADAERFPDVSLSIIKLLGAGQYALKRPGEPAEGHFGLGLDDYTHATAPNRRFPDLITQRIVKAALMKQRPPYAEDELRALAEHCTTQEGNAAKVERRVLKSAAAALLAPRMGERFDGIITGANEKGTWVRITHPLAEGRVVRGSAGLDVGDRVRVELVHTDVARGFVDFARAG